MKKSILCLFFLTGCLYHATAQSNTYLDSMQQYQERYVKEHGVIKGKDKSLLRFFPVSEKYKVKASFQRIYEASWFNMETSGKEKQVYRVYGVLNFELNDTAVKLYVYQSQRLMNTKEYADHLFAPFTDKTNGEETYENGRYIDMTEADLSGDVYFLDFNTAYNPYCAYVSNTFNCPIPPKENDLPVAVRSGEMKYRKGH
ncbi:MAG: DUF1684 domain-containing protein [Chitinophagaceae bacterium]